MIKEIHLKTPLAISDLDQLSTGIRFLFPE
jgi:hypothetical protein